MITQFHFQNTQSKTSWNQLEMETLKEKMENLKVKMEKVLYAPQDDEINQYYSFIRQDPDFLRAIDVLQFSDTPLHLAAGEGRTMLALEILRQIPSFGRKLNLDGHTPVNLALVHGHVKTARAMVSLDHQLAGVCGREGMTALHHAAREDKAEYLDALAEFLYHGPDSIRVLTNKEESAVHVAVKNEKVKAFKVLLGWVKRTGEREALRWRDCDGNTAMHLAAYTNQGGVLEMLREETVFVNDKNAEELTAKEIIAKKLPVGVDNRRALNALREWRYTKFKSCSSDNNKKGTFAGYLSSPLTINEWVSKSITYISRKMSNDTRNAIIVVAVLIATATFQAVLSAPGGFADSNRSTDKMSNGPAAPVPPPSNNNTGNDGIGKANMPVHDYKSFVWLNSIALATSLGTILLALPAHWANLLLYVSVAFMASSYTVAVRVTSPDNTPIIKVGSYVPYMVIFLVVTAKLIVLENRIMWVFRTRMGIQFKACNVEEDKALTFHGKYMRIDASQI